MTGNSHVENDAMKDTNQYIHVQLRPSSQMFRKCFEHIKGLSADHPKVAVNIAGYAVEDHQFLITLAISLGPRELVAKFSDEAVNAYNFTQMLFTDLFDYLPQYTAEPCAAERELAAKLPSLVAEEAASTGAAPMVPAAEAL